MREGRNLKIKRAKLGKESVTSVVYYIDQIISIFRNVLVQNYRATLAKGDEN